MGIKIKEPELIYHEWRASLESPDSSMFYYHPSLERIILGLSIYHIASRQYLPKIKNEKTIIIYNIYINKMVTAWIDESECFEHPFKALMTLSEAFPMVVHHLSKEHPEQQKAYKALINSFFFWGSISGDMSQDKADILLDNIETDGKRISSTKISHLIERLQPIVANNALDMEEQEVMELINNIDFSTL